MTPPPRPLFDGNKVPVYHMGKDGRWHRELSTPSQRDYLKILIGALNLAIAILIFVEVYG